MEDGNGFEGASKSPFVKGIWLETQTHNFISLSKSQFVNNSIIKLGNYGEGEGFEVSGFNNDSQLFTQAKLDDLIIDLHRSAKGSMQIRLLGFRL